MKIRSGSAQTLVEVTIPVSRPRCVSRQKNHNNVPAEGVDEFFKWAVALPLLKPHFDRPEIQVLGSPTGYNLWI